MNVQTPLLVSSYGGYLDNAAKPQAYYTSAAYHKRRYFLIIFVLSVALAAGLMVLPHYVQMGSLPFPGTWPTETCVILNISSVRQDYRNKGSTSTIYLVSYLVTHINGTASMTYNCESTPCSMYPEYVNQSTICAYNPNNLSEVYFERYLEIEHEIYIPFASVVLWIFYTIFLIFWLAMSGKIDRNDSYEGPLDENLKELPYVYRKLYLEKRKPDEIIMWRSTSVDRLNAKSSGLVLVMLVLPVCDLILSMTSSRTSISPYATLPLIFMFLFPGFYYGKFLVITNHRVIGCGTYMAYATILSIPYQEIVDVKITHESLTIESRVIVRKFMGKLEYSRLPDLQSIKKIIEEHRQAAPPHEPTTLSPTAHQKYVFS